MSIKRLSFLRAAVALVLMAVLTFGFSAPSASAASGKITIKNRSGEAIYYLYISPSSSSDWEEDVLGSDVLGKQKESHRQLPHGLP